MLQIAKEKIKSNPKKVTITSMTTIAVLVLLLLNIFEKAEPIVARLLKSKPALEENYNLERYMNDFETKPAEKK